MIKICKVLSIGQKETGVGKESGKKWSKISIKVQIVGTEQEIVASKFEMEDSKQKFKLSDIESLQVNSVHCFNFGFNSREYNGKYYLDITINKITSHEVDKPEKYNGKKHYVSGIVYQNLGERTFEAGSGIDFLLLSGTGNMIPMSYFTKNADSFNTVKDSIKEGTPITVGISFSSSEYQDKEYCNLYVNKVIEIEKASKPETAPAPTPKPAPVPAPVEDDDDLPF